MSDWRKFEPLFYGPVPQTIINEPPDEPKAESATARARRRWHMTEEGEARER
jgi:hypothetical protein